MTTPAPLTDWQKLIVMALAGRQVAQDEVLATLQFAGYDIVGAGKRVQARLEAEAAAEYDRRKAALNRRPIP